jgi:hypothetical protein
VVREHVGEGTLAPIERFAVSGDAGDLGLNHALVHPDREQDASFLEAFAQRGDPVGERRPAASRALARTQ